MRIIVLITLTQILSIQKSVSQVISYCYYVDRGRCISDIEANSSGSVLRRETAAKINVTCMSPQPVKWDLNILDGKKIEDERTELLRANGSGNVSYYLEINIDLEGLNGMINCKNYDGKHSANVFIDTEKDLKFLGQQSGINFYVTEPKEEFVVPCVAAGVDNVPVNLLTTSKENKVQSGVSASCIRCLCNQDCDGGDLTPDCMYCGPFYIGKSYWSEANDQQSKALDNKDWRACTKNYACSVKTILMYMGKHRKDCNGDGVITCEDIVAIHHGGSSCWDAKKNIANHQSCINNITSDTNITDIATYDPKIGFTINGPVDLTQYYICTDAKRKEQVTYAPLIPKNRIPAKIYYDFDPSGFSSKISCECDRNVSLDLIVASCHSLHHCATKLRPGLGSTMFADAISLKVGYQKPGLASYTPEHAQGMIGCFKIIENELSVSPQYVREVEHYFTGLDSRIYIATNNFTPEKASSTTNNAIATNDSSATEDSNRTSESIPIGALVQLSSTTFDKFIDGTQHAFFCRISTFMLLPDIQFSVTLKNGQRIELQSGSSFVPLSYEVQPTKYISKPMAVQQDLKIKVESNMKEISCTAHLINSDERLNQTFTLDFETGGGSWKIGLLSTALIMLALVSLGAIFFLFLKYRRVKRRLRQLTEEEVDVFYNGHSDSNEKSDPENIDVDKISFPTKFKLSPNAFKLFQNDVLGEGEYGRCIKGEMEGQDVAVKTTKSQTDVEYFKAFLKEVKVMAYIDSHENIVEFMGAMVDRISERVCYVVLELSPYGDLLGYLRKYSDKFELNQEPTTHDDKTSVDKEIIRCVDLTNFCVQIASGMEHLSRKKMIHGDLAARNVLVFPNSRVKITDFGLSRKLYGSSNYTKKNATPLPWRWMALESLKYLNFSTASDMWSFGVTMWEIFTLGLVPYPELTWSNDFIDNLHNGLRLQRPAHATVELYDLMTRSWSQLPKDRPTFEEAKYFLRSITQKEHNQGYVIVDQDQNNGDVGIEN